MAEVCEHCQGPVSRHEAVAVRDGYSYHMKCHKCYVCSERDLQNAELFKGVIFCSSCAQRIFQGCSTARQTKDYRYSSGQHHRTQRRRNSIDGIIELTTLTMSSESSDQRNSCKAKSSTSSKNGQEKQVSSQRNLKKSSVEMGMTTDVTQELLKQMQCPIPAEREKTPHGKPRKNRRERRKKTECSDLRIAELGASTEIAHMALRNKSEQPVIMHSETRIIKMASKSKSTKESQSESGDQGANTDSAYGSERSDHNRTWMERTLGSLIKMPYKVFVKKVLQRSSLISIIMSSKNSHSDLLLLKRLKGVFHDEVTEHQNRGVRRLFSTINRKQIPNKLGWLDVSARNRSTVDRSKHRCRCHNRCKHFNKSHSYRCMRAQVMRLAGPTESELAGFRNKVMDFVSPGFIRRKMPPMLMSQACGNSIKS